MKLQAYLMFGGNCEEAANFYISEIYLKGKRVL